MKSRIAIPIVISLILAVAASLLIVKSSASIDSGTRIIRVIALADEEYRQAHSNWKNDIRSIVAAASRTYEREARLGFVVVEARSWASRDDCNSMDYLYGQLCYDFARPEDTLVIAFTRQLVTDKANKYEQAGASREFGRHVLILDSPNATSDENATLLMHEIGHSFGLQHCNAPGKFMYPVNSRRTTPALDPDNLTILRIMRDIPIGVLHRSYIYITKGELREVIKAYQHLEAASPNETDITAEIGLASITLKDDSGAKIKLVQALQKDKSHPMDYVVLCTVHDMLGWLLYKQKNYTDAATYLKQTIKLSPNWDVPYRQVSKILAAQGKWNDAEQEINKAISLSPNSHLNHEELGWTLIHKNQEKKALKEYREAAHLEPDCFNSHHMLTHVLMNLKRWKEEEQEARIAIQLNPKSYCAHQDLGHALIDQHKLDEGVREVQIALRLNPKSAFAHSLMTYVYFVRGQREKAFKECLLSVSQNPKSPLAHGNLALAYYEKGNKQMAMKEAVLCNKYGGHTSEHDLIKFHSILLKEHKQ